MTDFKAKMHQIRFQLELRPRPRWGSLQRSPRHLSWIWGPLRGRGGGWAGEEEGKGEGKGSEGGSGGEGNGGPQVTVEPGPLRALLRHWGTALARARRVCVADLYGPCSDWSTGSLQLGQMSPTKVAMFFPSVIYVF